MRLPLKGKSGREFSQGSVRTPLAHCRNLTQNCCQLLHIWCQAAACAPVSIPGRPNTVPTTADQAADNDCDMVTNNFYRPGRAAWNQNDQPDGPALLLSRSTRTSASSPFPSPLRGWLVLVPLIALAGCQSVEDAGLVISGSLSGLRSPPEETENQRQKPPSPEIEGETRAAAQTLSPPFSLPPNVGGRTGSGSGSGTRPSANEADDQPHTPEVESAKIVAVQTTPLPASPPPDDIGKTGSDSQPGDRPQDNEAENSAQTSPLPEIESEAAGAAQTISPPVSLAPNEAGGTGSNAEPDGPPQDNEPDDLDQTPASPAIDSETTVAAQTTPSPSSPARDDVGQTDPCSEPSDLPQTEETGKQNQMPPSSEIDSETRVAAVPTPPSSPAVRTEGFVIPASIIDGDSFRLGDRPIRLHGIDAPELDQTCEVDGQTIACGQNSRQTLIGLTVGALVECDRLDVDADGRDVSRCFADGLDISSAMVRGGHAVADREAAADYVTDEIGARGNKYGLWRGTFQMPWEWRANKGQNAQ